MCRRPDLLLFDDRDLAFFPFLPLFPFFRRFLPPPRPLDPLDACRLPAAESVSLRARDGRRGDLLDMMAEVDDLMVVFDVDDLTVAFELEVSRLAYPEWVEGTVGEPEPESDESSSDESSSVLLEYPSL